MKKILTLVLISLISLSLTGCEFVRYTATDSTSSIKVAKTESLIDKEAIAQEIYDNIYSKVEQELKEQIKQEIINSYSDGIDLDSLQDQIYSVINNCSLGNIGVTTYKKNSNNEEVAYTTGSGVIYEKQENEDGSEKLYRYYYITNQHVIDGGTSYKATFADESEITSTLVGADETTDIAVLYFDSNNTYTVNKLGDSDNVKVGTIVLAIGNPKGESLFGSVTFGIIGGKNRNLLEQSSDGSYTKNTILSYLQHDAAINSGNSGGGLYNLNGECLGINSIKYAASDIEGLNFSIPINLVKKVTSEIREYGSYSGNVSLGVTATNVSQLTIAGRAQYLVSDDITSGVVVISVVENGSSDGIIEVNDIIIEMDGIEINTMNDLQPIIKSHVVGDKSTIKVIRADETTETGYKTIELEVTFKRTKTN